MGKDRLVTVVVGPRAFPYHGVTYEPGASLDVPLATAKRMESANPRFGRRVSDAELAALTDPWDAFSETARAAMEDAGYSPADYDGKRRANGAIHAPDVEAWLSGAGG